MEEILFSNLELSKEVLKAISEMGFEEPTPVQAKSIPLILDGKDIIGQAQTGTGKTCAFGIPIVEMINQTSESIQALVICPTRELAIQIAEEIKMLTTHKRGIKILPIYGGQQIDRQIFALKKKPQIIIGTPGRVMDHMRRGTLKLGQLKVIVLDEADEMLNMGFREDIDIILQEVPEERQTLLFSATMPHEIIELTRKYQKSPVHVKTVHKELTVPSIEQFYFEVSEGSKIEILSRLIEVNNIKLALVFCNTKRKVDEVVYHMQSRGYNAEGLHGDMRQMVRDRVMSKFRTGTLEVLVATDVAARGIDVDDVEVVVNYDIPNDDEYYVHRIGRTGRAGKSGIAYTFVVGREIFKLRDIQKYSKAKILPQKTPTIVDIEENKVNSKISAVKDTISKGNLSEYVNYIEKIQQELVVDTDGDENAVSALEIAAAFLKMAVGESLSTRGVEADIDISEETGANKGMARLFINIGSGSQITSSEIVEAICSQTSLPNKLIGKINIFDKFTFVEIPVEYALEVINLTKNLRIRGKKINVEKAVKKDGVKEMSGKSSYESDGKRESKGYNKSYRDSADTGYSREDRGARSDRNYRDDKSGSRDNRGSRDDRSSRDDRGSRDDKNTRGVRTTPDNSSGRPSRYTGENRGRKPDAAGEKKSEPRNDTKNVSTSGSKSGIRADSRTPVKSDSKRPPVKKTVENKPVKQENDSEDKKESGGYITRLTKLLKRDNKGSKEE